MSAPGYAAVARDLAGDAYGLCVASDKHDDFAGRVKTREQVARLIDDAIKTAVAAANNRAADAFSDWHRDILETTALGRMNVDQFEAWLRSGEDAPGVVGK